MKYHILLALLTILCILSETQICSIRIKKEDKNRKYDEVDIKKILKEEYPVFVQELGKFMSDPKFKDAIRSLASKGKIEYKKMSVPVKSLIPTQREIDVEKSLNWPLTNEKSARDFLFCKSESPLRIADKSIVTSNNGEYIIDGHHRWSQIFAINPKCTIDALDLQDIDDPIDALKVTQLGIALGKDQKGNEITQLPTLTVTGKNLIEITQIDLKNYVIEKITPSVFNVFQEFDPALNSKEKVAQYIWKNVKKMQNRNRPVKNAPDRGLMPQTEITTDWKDNILKVDSFLN